MELCAKRGADVIAVEAQDGFIPCIKENLESNGCLDRAHIIHGLVGSNTGVFSEAENFESADHYNGTMPTNVSVADVLGIYPGREVHLLKMDVEGSEFDLFSGDLSWLSNVRRIAMEVHGSYGNPDFITGLLRSEGFQAFLCDERGHRVEALAHAEDNGLIFGKRGATT